MPLWRILAVFWGGGALSQVLYSHLPLCIGIKSPYFWGQESLPRWQVTCLSQLSAVLLAYFLIWDLKYPMGIGGGMLIAESSLSQLSWHSLPGWQPVQVPQMTFFLLEVPWRNSWGKKASCALKKWWQENLRMWIIYICLLTKKPTLSYFSF